MALRSAYEAFLAAPSAAALASDAGMHYVTTLTSFSAPQSILDHLKKQALQLKTVESDVLSAVEGPESLVLEIGTTLEFITAGGAYLPGLDDNFLADKKAHVPIIHIVKFTSGKIQQIRLHWDQSTFLKQLEVIGARGKNWPIRDGREQAKLVKTSVSAGKIETTAKPELPLQTPSKVNPTRDPHGSLALFGPQDDNVPVIKPYATPATSARPPPRDYGDLFVGSDNETTPSATNRHGAASQQTQASPTKPHKNVGKQYQPSRLFDEAPEETPAKPSVVTNPKQYNHFEFGDGEDAAPVSKPITPPKTNHFEFGDGEDAVPVNKPPTPPKTGHASSWDFEDFTTPAKPQPKIRGQDVRHFGWSDDEETESPLVVKKVPQPRRDAEAHFDFVDETPNKHDGQQKRGSQLNTGSHLYENHIFGNESPEKPAPQRSSGTNTTFEGHRRTFDSQFSMTDSLPETDDKASKPLSNVTNATMNGHRRTFDSQFSMTDDSPSMKENKPEGGAQKTIANDRLAAVKMMDSSWDVYTDSPEEEQPSKKENVPLKQSVKTGVNTVGDGMGGRNGQNRSWGFGSESDPEDEIPEKKKVRDPAQTAAKGGGFWDFE